MCIPRFANFGYIPSRLESFCFLFSHGSSNDCVLSWHWKVSVLRISSCCSMPSVCGRKHVAQVLAFFLVFVYNEGRQYEPCWLVHVFLFLDVHVSEEWIAFHDHVSSSSTCFGFSVHLSLFECEHVVLIYSCGRGSISCFAAFTDGSPRSCPNLLDRGSFRQASHVPFKNWCSDVRFKAASASSQHPHPPRIPNTTHSPVTSHYWWLSKRATSQTLTYTLDSYLTTSQLTATRIHLPQRPRGHAPVSPH